MRRTLHYTPLTHDGRSNSSSRTGECSFACARTAHCSDVHVCCLAVWSVTESGTSPMKRDRSTLGANHALAACLDAMLNWRKHAKHCLHECMTRNHDFPTSHSISFLLQTIPQTQRELHHEVNIGMRACYHLPCSVKKEIQRKTACRGYIPSGYRAPPP